MTFADAFARGSRLALATGLCLQLSLPGVAHAQSPGPSASDLESARDLYRQGKELRAAGQVDAALEKFQAAHTYGQTPITGLELGRTHVQLGHLLEAREVLLSVARLKVQPDESENAAQARREAHELAEQIRPRLATLSLHVGRAPNTVVTVDGAKIPVVGGMVERKLNPGKHTLVAAIEGGDSKDAEVTLGEGESKALDLMPVPPVGAPAEGPGATDGNATPIESSSHARHGVHPLVWIGFGTAVAGVAVGAVTGGLALGKNSSAKTACGAAGSDDHACLDASHQADAESLRSSGQTLGTVSTIAFVIGGVGAAAGVVGLFLPHGASTKPGTATIRPVLGLGYAGLGGSF